MRHPHRGSSWPRLGGTALLSLGLAADAATHLDDAHARYELLGAVLFLSSIAITGGYHVPHNDSLDLVDPAGAGAGDAWLGYVRGWVVWNHVRTITPLAAGVSFVLALRAGMTIGRPSRSTTTAATFEVLGQPATWTSVRFPRVEVTSSVRALL